MPDPPALTLLPVAFKPVPGEFKTIPVVLPTNALVRIVPTWFEANDIPLPLKPRTVFPCTLSGFELPPSA